jgi:PII-like signaling protein
MAADEEGPVRKLEGEQILVRIFIGESDKWHHQPLYAALLERLRREGFAGATVYRAIAGFGAHSVVHTAHVLRLSEDLPIVVELVDSEEQLERLKPILDEMIDDGLVTMTRVQVLHYGPRSRN